MHKNKFTKRAKKEGLRSRSAYKLDEINKRFRIIKYGDNVLDLGCWPGGWMITAKKITQNGYVLGVDTKEIKPVEGCGFLLADVMKEDTLDKIKEMIAVVDVVLSDLAPNTTGIRELDIGRSKDLCLRALFIAIALLRVNGNFLCKLFQGEDSNEVISSVKKYFHQVRIYKPTTSKKRSREVYIIARGYKG